MEPITETMASTGLLIGALIAILVAMLFYLLYNRDFKRQLLMEEFNDDLDEVRAQIKHCTPGDAQKLIMSFRDRWMFMIEYSTLQDACEILNHEKPENNFYRFN